ncbi:MAG TPA: hypothetical protein DEO43_08570 [Halieaceae bacterium]|nr:hypothetical protein [Halieaceae bacterium]
MALIVYPLINHRSRWRCLNLLILLFCSVASIAQPAERYRPDSPNWMKFVAAINVPTLKHEAGRTRHYREQCSATLINHDHARQDQWLITAWHCIEHYRDLSQTIEVRFPHAGLNDQYYTARVARSGERLERDWALLRLEQRLPPHLSSPLTLTAASPSLLATAAGYSKHLREGRERLSYDSNCRWVSAQEWQDCFTSKGTSGGPVVQTIADEPTIVGIISQGNGEGMTLTFPVDLLPPF